MNDEVLQEREWPGKRVFVAKQNQYFCNETAGTSYTRIMIMALDTLLGNKVNCTEIRARKI